MKYGIEVVMIMTFSNVYLLVQGPGEKDMIVMRRQALESDILLDI